MEKENGVSNEMKYGSKDRQEILSNSEQGVRVDMFQKEKEIQAKMEVVEEKRGVVVIAEPLQDRVIVRKMKEDLKRGLIIVPEAVRENSTKGEVVAVGPGRVGEPMGLKVGYVVMFGKLIGTEIEIDGELFLLMRESDIFAVLDKSSAFEPDVRQIVFEALGELAVSCDPTPTNTERIGNELLQKLSITMKQ